MAFSKPFLLPLPSSSATIPSLFLGRISTKTGVAASSLPSGCRNTAADSGETKDFISAVVKTNPLKKGTLCLPAIFFPASDEENDDVFIEAAYEGKNPFLSGGWVLAGVVKETENEVIVKVDLPGIGKEDVKVWIEGDTLGFKAIEAEKTQNENIEVVEDDGGDEDEDEDEGEGEGRRSYYGFLDLPESSYEKDGLSAMMKNGVLEVVLKRLSLEEREDVTSIPVL